MADIFLQNDLKHISPFPTKSVKMETTNFSKKPNSSTTEEKSKSYFEETVTSTLVLKLTE